MSKSHLRKVSASGRRKIDRIVRGHWRLTKAQKNAIRRAGGIP